MVGNAVTPTSICCFAAAPTAQAGTKLFDMRGYAKPQRPKDGWSWVVHPSGKGSSAKQEAYVVTPTGQQRSLNEEEQYLQQRKTPKARRRWFGSTRRTS